MLGATKSNRPRDKKFLRQWTQNNKSGIVPAIIQCVMFATILGMMVGMLQFTSRANENTADKPIPNTAPVIGHQGSEGSDSNDAVEQAETTLNEGETPTDIRAEIPAEIEEKTEEKTEEEIEEKTEEKIEEKKVQILPTTEEYTYEKATSIVPLDKDKVRVFLYSEYGCKGSQVIISYEDFSGISHAGHDLCYKNFPDNSEQQKARSMIVVGTAFIELRKGCDHPNTPQLNPEKNEDNYVSTVTALDGCQDLYAFDWIDNMKMIDGSPTLHPTYANVLNTMPPLSTSEINIMAADEISVNTDYTKQDLTYHVAYSVESSGYFGFQVQSNYLAFQQSNQHPEAGYTRLVTMRQRDDLDMIPSWFGPRNPLTPEYSPYNKPDVVTKWFASPQRPTEDVTIIIDPDNWLTKSLQPYANRVKKGQAVGQAAWFVDLRELATELYQMVCRKNCDFHLDLVAVPYIVHTDDMAKIAPIWKEFTSILRKYNLEHPTFQKDFVGLQIDWCTEMFAYVFAAAELGIRHEVEYHLQIRDVDSRQTVEENSEVLMIHMGRAWVPPDTESHKQWMHTEGEAFAEFGMQVWCKCNYTASEILPWPIPDGTDFQSEVTLRLLHDAREKYGELPVNTNLRRYGDYDRFSFVAL